MKVIDLIKILELADHDSEVMVNCTDWSLRNDEVIVSSVSISPNEEGELICTLSYDKVEKPEEETEENADESKDSNEI